MTERQQSVFDSILEQKLHFHMYAPTGRSRAVPVAYVPDCMPGRDRHREQQGKALIVLINTSAMESGFVH